MEYVFRIISLLVELALLVRALFTDGTHFISLLARSRSALAAWYYSHTVSHGKMPW